MIAERAEDPTAVAATGDADRLLVDFVAERYRGARPSPGAVSCRSSGSRRGSTKGVLGIRLLAAAREAEAEAEAEVDDAVG